MKTIEELAQEMDEILLVSDASKFLIFLNENHDGFRDIIKKSLNLAMLYDGDFLKKLNVETIKYLFTFLKDIPVDLTSYLWKQCLIEHIIFENCKKSTGLMSLLEREVYDNWQFVFKDIFASLPSQSSSHPSSIFDDNILRNKKSLIEELDKLAKKTLDDNEQSFSFSTFNSIVTHSIFANKIFRIDNILKMNDITKFAIIKSFTSYGTWLTKQFSAKCKSVNGVKSFIYQVLCSKNVDFSIKSLLFFELQNDDYLTYHSSQAGSIYNMDDKLYFVVSECTSYAELRLKLTLENYDVDNRSLFLYFMLNRKSCFKDALEVDEEEIEALIPDAKRLYLKSKY